MDSTGFDRLAKRFAARPRSRRQVLRQGGAGLAASVLAAAGLVRQSGAQDATPSASPAASADLEPLFVQVFESGSFVPKEGEPGVYTLAFNHSSAQTVFFSNRPARVVGTVPTTRFSPSGDAYYEPPNAALVTRAADGAEDVLVVELLRPTYDETAATLAYDVRVLENYAEAGSSLSYLAERQTDLTVPERFGQASLFIDDCPSGSVWCHACLGGDYRMGSWDGVPMCWGEDTCCGPCESHDSAVWGQRCNARFPGCNGTCVAELEGTLAACDNFIVCDL